MDDGSFFRVLKPATVKAPQHLSITALQEIEACPARWIFAHARYEELDGGYPSKPAAAGIRGQIIHSVLENFGQALNSAGNPIAGSEEYDEVRQSIPVRKLVLERREALLAAAEKNPRADVRVLRNEVSVDATVNAFKRLMGADIFDQTDYQSVPDAQGRCPPRVCTNDPVPPVPVPALLPEQWVEIEEPPICGRIDLIATAARGDTLTDFKTGAKQPKHVEQVNFYSVLWSKSRHRSIAARRITYADGKRIRLAGLSASQVDELAKNFTTRVQVARGAISSAPLASPEVETCKFCQVRQLCDAYWESSHTEVLRWHITEVSTNEADWKDIQIDLADCVITGSVISATFGQDQGPPIAFSCVVPKRFMQSKKETDAYLRVTGVLLKRDNTRVSVVWAGNSEAYWL